MTATRAGARLGGRYRLTERLAFGGMGEVWSGVDEVLGRAVAVKILRPELARDNAFRRRFREEARTAGGLSHPGIAAVYDYGEGPPVQPGSTVDNGSGGGYGNPGGRGGSYGEAGHGGSYGEAGYGGGNGGYRDHEPDWTSGDDVAYLVMELVPGKPLSAILAESGPLPPVRALELVAQAARALHAAHQRGVVHRDVKPANLMVTPEGRLKVTDFGIARPQDHEPLTATGQVMGTAHYLAPELARGHLATALSDVYALGVVAYECVAGRRPFEGDNQVAVATAHLSEDPPPLPSDLPPDVRRVIMTAMQKEPDYRFANADSFAEVLDFVRFRLLADDPPPIWATRGPVPGVGTGTVRLPDGPRTPGVGNRGTTSFLAEVGATRTGTGMPSDGYGGGSGGRPGHGGTGTEALPLGGARYEGLDRMGRQQPRRRIPALPLLAGLVALITAVSVLVIWTGVLDGTTTTKNPGTQTSTPAVVPTPSASDVPTESLPTGTTRSTFTGTGGGHRTGTPTAATTRPRTATSSLPTSATSSPTSPVTSPSTSPATSPTTSPATSPTTTSPPPPPA